MFHLNKQNYHNKTTTAQTISFCRFNDKFSAISTEFLFSLPLNSGDLQNLSSTYLGELINVPLLLFIFISFVLSPIPSSKGKFKTNPYIGTP